MADGLLLFFTLIYLSSNPIFIYIQMQSSDFIYIYIYIYIYIKLIVGEQGESLIDMLA